MTRKQTSAKVSKLAAKYLAMSDFALWDILDRGTRPQKDALFKAVRTLAASCLSQDEEPRVFSTKPMPKNTAPTLKFHRPKQARKLSKEMVSAHNVDGVVSVTKRKVKP